MKDKVSELEAAILAQADRLAEQYREQARHSAARILKEARERLHLREEREVLLAKAQADRSYRRQVLSRELAMQAKLDALRWELVRGVQDRALDDLRKLTGDSTRYLALLTALIAQAVPAFDQPSLVVECNARDHALLSGQTAALQQAAGAVQLTLGDRQLDCSGGVLLRTPDDRQRLDQTFEGRMHRLAGELHRVIQDNLLPASPEDHNTHIVT